MYNYQPTFNYLFSKEEAHSFARREGIKVFLILILPMIFSITYLYRENISNYFYYKSWMIIIPMSILFSIIFGIIFYMIYLKWAAGSEISIKGDNLSWNLSLKHRVIRRNEIRRIVDHKNFVLIQSKSISIYIPKSSKAYAAVIDFVHLHPLGKNITSENNKPT